MKKTTNSWGMYHMPWKYDLKMKLTIFFAAVCLFQLKANSSYSQSTKLSLSMNDVTLNEVIEEIESLSEFKFLYNRKDVDLKMIVSVVARKKVIAEILKDVFSGTDIEYEVLNKQIILRKKRAAPPLPVKNDVLQYSVSGSIIDERGNVLPGANIVEKGTINGTQSDFDGKFSLTLASENAVLIVSYIGYVTKEIQVQGTAELNIVLVESAAGLDEVVVVGYGQQRKSDVTGAVSQVSSDEITSYPVANFAQAIQGRASGVQVNQNNGSLEGGISIQIRGVGSTGDTEPLYVIDGVPLSSGSLETINPNDIESIDILKDASSTAIYGARASNGVVIITTKTGGRARKLDVNLSVQTTIDMPIETAPLASPEQTIDVLEAAFQNANLQVPQNLYTVPLETYNEWPDLITRNGIRNEYNISVSGGDEKTNFLISGNHINRDGVIINTDLNRTGLRVNVDHRANERFLIGARITGSVQESNGTTTDNFFQAPYRNSLIMRTYVPHLDENGEYLSIPPRNGIFGNLVYNPVAKVQTDKFFTRTSRYLGNVFAEYRLAKNLKFRTNLGFDYVFTEGERYFPILTIGGLYNRTTGRTEVDRFKEQNIVSDQLLTYNLEKGKHAWDLLVGFSAQKFNTNNVSTRAEGTLNNELNRLSNQPSIISSTDNLFQNGLLSYFTRINYGFDNKYLLTATIRRDGSSRFGDDNRFGWFPSASLGWRVSQEDFLKNSNTLNNLKLRVSYGQTGNQNIGNLIGIGTVSTGFYAFGNQLATSLVPNNFDNSDLKWETNTQFNAGIDIGFFKGRISSTIDYYKRISTDFLINVPVAAANGITSNQTQNLGELLNEGFEFSLSTININSNRFRWTTDFNIATNRNEVLDIGQDVSGLNRVIFGRPLQPPFNESFNRTQAGEPIGSLYGYEFLGIWQLDQADEAAVYGLVPGDTRFRDQNDDGVLNEDDKVFIGQPQPKVYGGLTNNLDIGNFSLGLFFNFQLGHRLLNTLNTQQEAGNLSARVTAEYAENFWTPERPSNIFSRPHRQGQAWENVSPSDRYIEDASFLRLQQLSLGYSLPSKIIERIPFTNINISCIATNLWTLTNYRGLDPEVSSAGNTISGGLDITPYPIPRSFSLRLNMNF